MLGDSDDTLCHIVDAHLWLSLGLFWASNKWRFGPVFRCPLYCAHTWPVRPLQPSREREEAVSDFIWKQEFGAAVLCFVGEGVQHGGADCHRQLFAYMLLVLHQFFSKWALIKVNKILHSCMLWEYLHRPKKPQLCSLFTSVRKYECCLEKWVLYVKVLPIAMKWK